MHKNFSTRANISYGVCDHTMVITRTSEKRMSLHTAPDSVLEVELKHMCLENGYTALLHRWHAVASRAGSNILVSASS